LLTGGRRKLKEVPSVALDIRVECQVNPSEDSAKVLRAVKNVVSNCSPEVADGRIRVASKNPEVLITIYEQIRSRRIMGVFRKVLLRNMIANSTWFYLNKQAAFVGTVSICEDESESPLGPIKITIMSNELEPVMNWLVEF
jgi:predicted RNA binding protein with dsRBD fold (UPF0201 family)